MTHFAILELVDRLGWTLIHSLWQFALVAIIAGSVIRALRRRSAEARYLVLVAAMAAAVTTSIATWIMLPSFTSTAASQEFANGGVSSIGADGADGARQLVPEDFRTGDQDRLTFASPMTSAGRGLALRRQFAVALRPWLSWIVAAWLAGAALYSLRLVIGWQTLRRLRSVGVSSVSDHVQSALERVANRLGLRQTVRVLYSSVAQVPVVVGFLRPVVLLPASLVANIPMPQLEAILAHELTHVRRHDFMVNLLQVLIETIFFYHPAVWWMSRVARAEREHCCDDTVVAVLGDRVAYGRALLAIGEHQQSSLNSVGDAGLALGAADGSLVARVRRIAGCPDVAENSRSAFGLVSCGILALIVASTLNWHSFAASPQDKDSPLLAQPPNSPASNNKDEKTNNNNDNNDGRAKDAASAVEALVRSFTNAPNDWMQLEWASKIVETGDTTAIPRIARHLGDPDRRTRCNAGFVLDGLRDARGLAAIIQELNDKEPRATTRIRSDGAPDFQGQITSDRYYAALLLGKIRKPEAVPALIATAGDKSISDIVAISLGDIRDPRAIPALRRMAQQFPENRLWAGYGLAALRDAEGFKILEEFSTHAVWTQRRHAVEALGKTGDTAGTPILIKALKDAHANVKVSAARSLGMIGDAAALPALKTALQDSEATTVNSPTTVAKEAQTAINAIEAKQAKRQAAAKPERKTAKATVLGTVVTPDDKAAVGIEVLAFQGGKQLAPKFTTDARGQFRVPREWREANQWLTLVARDGRKSLGWFDFMLHGHSDAGQKPKDGSFRIVLLPMTRTLRGRLLDDAGQPLPNIPIQINQLSHPVNLYAVHWRYQKIGREALVSGAVTDKDGRFQLPLPVGAFAWLGTPHPDWVEQSVRVPATDERIPDITMVRAAKVAGRVVDSRTNKPMPGVRVTATAATTELFESSSDSATTDASGDFVINGLKGGKFMIELTDGAAGDLTAPAHVAAQLKSGETLRADFALTVGRRLTGRVLDIDTGEPLSQCNVTCTSPASPSGHATETNLRGEFEFIVPPGPSKLDASMGRRFGAKSRQTIVVMADADPKPVVLEVGPKLHSVPGSLKIFVGPPLDRIVTAQFKRAPLIDVLKGICQSAGVEVEIDANGLKSQGYTQNMRVTIDVNKVSLQEALTQVLKPLRGLSFSLEEGRILVGADPPKP